MDIQVNNWDISEFTSGAQVQSSIPGDSADTPDLRHVSPGSGGAWSSAYREPWGSGDTLYDLQGLVSHSGTLHGVSKSVVEALRLFFLFVWEMILMF